MNKFYVLLNSDVDDRKNAVTDFLKEDSARRGIAPKCLTCGKYIGMLPWLPPFRAELEVWGKGRWRGYVI